MTLPTDPVFTKAELEAHWLALLTDAAFPERLVAIRGAADHWPEKKYRSIYVTHTDMVRHDMRFAEALFTDAERMLEAGDQAVRNLCPPDSPAKKELRLRIRGLPEVVRIPPGDLRAGHTGRLVAIPGRLRRIGVVKPKVVVGAFQCQRCGAVTEVPMPDFEARQPVECSEATGGCKRTSSSTNWRFLPSVSQFVNIQLIEVEDHYRTDTGHAPRVVPVFLRDDLVGIPPILNATFNGVVQSKLHWRGPKANTVGDFYVDVVSIDEDPKSRSVVVTPADEAAIKELAALPPGELFPKLVRSFCPTVRGYERIKESAILQLFGGVWREMPDGSALRGDSHILLVGDPSVAKSQLLDFASRLSPVGTYSSGEGSTGRGLTVSVIKDPGEDGWVVEFGPVVHANGGLAAVDEIEKMEDEDREKLHGLLERGRADYAKANRHGFVPCRMAMIAAANPEKGRFDPTEVLEEQTGLPPSLTSRFDIIWVMIDEPNEDIDGAIAEHVLLSHVADAPPPTPEVPMDLLTKYIAHARENVKPFLTRAVVTKLKDEYVRLRALAGKGARGVTITVRQLQGLIRLSQASARVRLSPAVEEGDVDRALGLFNEMLKKVAFDFDTGTIDMTVIATGRSQSQWDRLKAMRKAIKDHATGKNEGADLETVIRSLVDQGVDEERARSDFETLLRRGEVYSAKKDNHYRLLD